MSCYGQIANKHTDFFLKNMSFAKYISIKEFNVSLNKGIFQMDSLWNVWIKLSGV